MGLGLGRVWVRFKVQVPLKVRGVAHGLGLGRVKVRVKVQVPLN